MNTELQHYTVGDVDLMAKRMADSRLFPGIATPQAAFALMMLCQAEGLHPVQAMRRFHVIQGRPTMRADAMQAEFQRQGGTIRWLKSTAEECEARFIHATHAPDPGVLVRWDLAMAKRAGLLKNPTWASYPDAMLRARLISTGVRMVLPGVVVGIYTPEEAEDIASRPTPTKVIDVEPRSDANGHTNGHAELAPPPAADWRTFNLATVTAANDALDAECKIANITDRKGWSKLIGHPSQLTNAVASEMLAEGMVSAEDVDKPDKPGTRDPRATASAVARQFQDQPDWVRRTVGAYILVKFREARADLGLSAGDEDAEAAAVGTDDAWDSGRE